MSNPLLSRPCPCCQGTGVIALTPAHAAPYGMVLLRALAREPGTWIASADLPLPESALASTRHQALRRLSTLQLISGQRHSGLQYEWHITASGRALLARELGIS